MSYFDPNVYNCEMAGGVFDGIEKYLASQRMMLIVSIMDNYPTEE